MTAPAHSPQLPEGYALRPMTVQDIAAVHALETELFPADAWPYEMFGAELAHPTRAYWVLETAGQIVGYAGMMCIPPVADVQTIAVTPEHEGRGLGAALLETLHIGARAAGGREILLEVRADNPRAQRLYRRFGYEHIHTRRHYYQDGHDALIMRCELTAATTAHPDDAAATTAHADDAAAGTEPSGVGATERTADGRTIHRD